MVTIFLNFLFVFFLIWKSKKKIYLCHFIDFLITIITLVKIILSYLIFILFFAIRNKDKNLKLKNQKINQINFADKTIICLDRYREILKNKQRK